MYLCMVLGWVYLLSSHGIGENKKGVIAPNGIGYLLLVLMFIVIGAIMDMLGKCGVLGK